MFGGEIQIPQGWHLFFPRGPVGRKKRCGAGPLADVGTDSLRPNRRKKRRCKVGPLIARFEGPAQKFIYACTDNFFSTT